MKAQIVEYYISERQWSVQGLWIAAAILILSVVLWKTAPEGSIQRGLSYALAAGGLLFVVATGLTIRHNGQRIAAAEQITEKNEQVLQQQETARMENVMRNAYKTGLISFSIGLLTGIVLLIALKAPFSKGIALGVLLFGAYGLLMETLSMRQNRAYLEEVKGYKISLENSR